MNEPLAATAMLCLLTSALWVTLPIFADGIVAAVGVLFPRKGL